MSTKSVSYVNHLGQTVYPADIAKKHKPVRAKSEGMKTLDTHDGAKISMGFEVTGFTRERLEWAKGKHEEVRASQQGRSLEKGEKLLQPWNEDFYMREAKPMRVAPKPYTHQSSAEQCAAMASAAGWINVKVREILKG